MRILISFWNQGSESRAIPYGYNGAVFCYVAADAAVTDYELLVEERAADAFAVDLGSVA
ncbi:MAG: hypothetical protein LBE74_03335 [Treponema sp.]|nr:hypothetical protein [Treponema sp.]